MKKKNRFRSVSVCSEYGMKGKDIKIWTSTECTDKEGVGLDIIAFCCFFLHTFLVSLKLSFSIVVLWPLNRIKLFDLVSCVEAKNVLGGHEWVSIEIHVPCHNQFTDFWLGFWALSEVSSSFYCKWHFALSLGIVCPCKICPAFIFPRLFSLKANKERIEFNWGFLEAINWYSSNQFMRLSFVLILIELIGSVILRWW